MVQSKTILNALPNVLKTIDIPDLGKKYQGKVRDFYFRPERRIIITTDRQSAFDVILGHIPYKGAIINSLASFWFEKTKHIIDNHVIAVPDPNVTIAHNCLPVPVEIIVRGYLSGVTNTSIWSSYAKGERNIYGIQFPDGMKKNDKLPEPVITPTTHAATGEKVHDERLTKEDIINKNIVDKNLYEKIEKAALELFTFGQKWCERQGLILVDTKYEFGLVDNKLILMDEIHTSDSSRFWIKETYKQRISAGEEPENFDKEFLRLWYNERGYKGEGKPPKMSDDLIVAAAQRYIAVYEKITGQKFIPFKYPIEERIKKNLNHIF